MATATRTRTLEILCPVCMDADNAVRLNLNDLGECQCDCGETFSADEAARKFARLAEKWAKVAAWVDSAPTV